MPLKLRVFYDTALTWFFTAILATGTPDGEVIVNERLLGSNSEGFLTLRTEEDNLGSYYKVRTKRFLVESSKLTADPKDETSLGSEVKRQLLLEVSTSFDAAHASPFSDEAKSETIVTKNEDIKLAELLLQFPEEPKRWDTEKCGKITCDSTNGPRLGAVDIAWGGWIKERFGVDRNAQLEWKLNEIFEDGNCLYLSVSSESLGQRLVSISPRKTQQVRDQLAKFPVYLVARKFKTKDEAVQWARELMNKTQGKFKFEVWSQGRWKEEMMYVVVDTQSEEHIKGNAFETLENLTDVDFSVMSSKDFVERIAVPLSK